MDQVSQRDLRILTAIAERQDVTQRSLAKNLGIALGLTNLYLKRLARKGYIKITTIPARRVGYLLTPSGIAEKTRLTYEYMAYSVQLYRQTRQTLREALGPLIDEDSKRFALYGVGEAAELAYLTLREFAIEPVGVYAEEGRETFLSLPVHPVTSILQTDVDRVIVATFDAPERHRVALARLGVPREKLLFLVREPEESGDE